MRITYRGVGLGTGYTGAAVTSAGRNRAFAGGLGTYFTPTPNPNDPNVLNARITQLEQLVSALRAQPQTPQVAAETQRAQAALERATAAVAAPPAPAGPGATPTPRPTPSAPATPAATGGGPTSTPAPAGWKLGQNGLWYQQLPDGTFNVRGTDGQIVRVNRDGTPVNPNGPTRSPAPPSGPSVSPSPAAPTGNFPPPGTPIDWITDPNVHGAENVQALAGATFVGTNSGGDPVARLADGRLVVLAPEVFDGTPWAQAAAAPPSPPDFSTTAPTGTPGADTAVLTPGDVSTPPAAPAEPAAPSPAPAPSVSVAPTEAPSTPALIEGPISAPAAPAPTPAPAPAPAYEPDRPQLYEGPTSAPAPSAPAPAPAPEPAMFSDRYGNRVTLDQLLAQWQTPMAEAAPSATQPVLTQGDVTPPPPPPPPSSGTPTGTAPAFDPGSYDVTYGAPKPPPLPGDMLTEF